MSHRIKILKKLKKLNYSKSQIITELSKYKNFKLLQNSLSSKPQKFQYSKYFEKYSDKTLKLVKLRKYMNKTKPSFKRYKSQTIKRIPESWRYPRGLQNKCRLQRKNTPSHPKIGYSKPKLVRGLNQKSCPEILVRNLQDLKNIINSQTRVMILLSKRLGLKKRLEIQELAIKNNLFVKNWINLNKYI
jgi:ribosomal protein L32E